MVGFLDISISLSTMFMNLVKFYEQIRKTPFGGKLTQAQVDNIEGILHACESEKVVDERHISYILATAFHECYNAKFNPNFDPVREGFTNSDVGAISHITDLFNHRKIKINYALPGKNGKSFFGRGYVQLTWERNYQRMGKILDIDLYDNPDLALKPEVAAKILVKGMQDGLFTGKSLSVYFNEKTSDLIGARRIINGTDQAQRIAGYAHVFRIAMEELS
jgi:putative chitinase